MPAGPLNTLGEQMRNDLPPVLRADPDILGIINAQSKELAQLGATIDTLRNQFFPQKADIALALWEALTRTTINPTAVIYDYPALVLSHPGLVAYWRLGEESGTVAVDEKNALNGTYTGGFTLDQPGAIANDPDRAVLLNGSSGYVAVPDNNLLDVGDTFSIEAFVKLGAVGTTQTIYQKGNGPGCLQFNSSNKLELRKPGGGTIVQSLGTYTAGQYLHVIATKNAGTSAKLYVNGADVSDTVTNQTCTNTANAVALGAQTAGGGGFLNGDLDEAALYNLPLTAAEALAHYNAAINAPTYEMVATQDRRDVVIALLRKLLTSPSGADWVANTTLIVGGGSWSYREHDPDDTSGPPPYTVWVFLPYAPEEGNYAQIEGFLRAITPANTDLVIGFEEGFVLGESELGEEPL